MYFSLNSGYLQNLRDRFYFLRQSIQGYPITHRFFKQMTGYSLDLKNPLTHNERIVHKKLFDRDPLLIITSDKVKVRDYVTEKLGEEEASKILIPVYHISKTGEDIPHESWDFEFFMKSNHQSRANLLVKPGENPEKIKSICKKWLSQSYGQALHEWAYRDIPRRIICEKVIRTPEGMIPMDVKFYCFNAKVKMVLFLADRFGDQSRIFTDENKVEIPGSQQFGAKKLETIPDFPTYGKMLELSQILSQPFQYCRVDFYTVGNSIFFGELTHYTGSGIEKFDDWNTDRVLGELWKPENKDVSFFEMRQKLFPNT